MASDAMYGRRVRGTYKKRAADSQRAFAGVNVVLCADFGSCTPSEAKSTQSSQK